MTDQRLLHGTADPPPTMRPLRAGPVTVLLDGVDLRYVRAGQTELIRRVYAAVRDTDWDTIPAVISGLEVEEGDDAFLVRFSARHTAPSLDFSWSGTIEGAADGTITYTFDGRAEAALRYNRIGLCVHHPWRETAGRPFRARTPDGPLEDRFPDLIGPQAFDDGHYWALFPAFDRLELDLEAGGRLELEFEGDLWETEDHRNWTDANFKTYSTPIALPAPHTLEPGGALVQRLVIRPVDVPGDAATAGGPTRLEIGEPTGTVVPSLGLGIDRDGHRPSERELALLGTLGPAHLRVEARLNRDGWEERVAAAQSQAGALGAHLEVSVHLEPEHAPLLARLGDALAGGPPVDRVLVIHAGGRIASPLETTPAELVDTVRDALGSSLPGAAFAGGSEMYFTELNRTRPDPSRWDAVCFSITPQIHAFTDVDIVENLDAQGENVRSAHALAGGKPIVISPITIRRRFNFHAADPEPKPAAGELPDAVDPRQASLLGAAWTAGSLKYVAERGVASVTYYTSTGWEGVVERDEGTPLPERFPSTAGQAFPLLHPLADVAGWRGAQVLACPSDEPLAAVALAVRDDGGALRLLVANVTPREQDVVVAGPLAARVALRRLNESTAELAGGDPEAFRAAGEQADVGGAELALRLAPYEVVRIDPA